MLIKQRVNINMLCLNELHDILRELCFDMSIQQIHELYLYCTFDVKEKNKLSVKEKLMSLVNQERKKASVELIVEWLERNMPEVRVRVKATGQGARNKSVHTEKMNTTMGLKRDKQPQPQATFRLPTISASSSDKLKNELQPLIELFD